MDSASFSTWNILHYVRSLAQYTIWANISCTVHPVLPTWYVLLADQLYEQGLDCTKGLLRNFSACHILLPAGTERSLYGEHLHHVDGAGPVAGPVGEQHGLGLIMEDGEQAGTAGLAGWMDAVGVRGRGGITLLAFILIAQNRLF